VDLILWRHAEAEDAVPGRIGDQARALTEHGHKQARKMAGWLKKHLPADCRILVSPAARTQQTVAALGLPFVTDAEIGTASNARRVLKAAHWEPAGKGTVLVVGHQPTLGEVASLLLAGEAADMSIKKGAVVWIASNPDGNKLHKAITPGDL